MYYLLVSKTLSLISPNQVHINTLKRHILTLGSNKCVHACVSSFYMLQCKGQLAGSKDRAQDLSNATVWREVRSKVHLCCQASASSYAWAECGEV